MRMIRKIDEKENVCSLVKWYPKILKLNNIYYNEDIYLKLSAFVCFLPKKMLAKFKLK